MAKQLNGHILIVDDNEDIRAVMITAVQSMGYRVMSAADGAAAINFVNSNQYDIVLLDIEMPRVDGFEVLQYVKDHSPSTEVIMLTGKDDVKTAVKAMQLGASNYMTKPVQMDELEIVVNRTIKQKQLVTSTILMQRSLQRFETGNAIIGQSEAWLSLLDKARRFALSDFLIHVEGESGTGKEVIANYIHSASPRKDKPFVVVDCGVIHESLIESELFGHIKGSFTGADSSKEGLVEIAQGGTLFLDEIGHIDLVFQQKLLKFVETKSYRRVGDTVTRTVDVRIVTATNRNLAEEAKTGQFRSDLWYRLNVMKLEIPPLRARRSDISILAKYFLDKFNHTSLRKELTAEAIALLERYQWPGNIRELQSTIQRAIALSDDENITGEDLAIEPQISVHLDLESIDGAKIQSSLVSLSENEKKHLQFVLESAGWNISQAAKILQIGRNTLYSKMKEFGIEQPDSR